MKIKVKICGITNLEDAAMCSQEGADLLGFIFVKESPRYIKPEQAKKIFSLLEPFIFRVGVFMNEDKEKVLNIAEKIKLDVLQFHGDEPPSYCNFFKKKFRVVKTLFNDNIEKISQYKKVDAFLLDIRGEKKNEGLTVFEAIDYQKVNTLSNKFPIIISGGLQSDKIKSLFKKISPYAVDVARGVEISPGKKDRFKVRQFIKEVKRNLKVR